MLNASSAPRACVHRDPSPARRPAPRPPGALVFDCDGLLVDTEPLWFASEGALYARRGLTFDAQAQARLIGNSLDQNAVTIARDFDEAGRETVIADELLGLVAASFESGATAMPGAHDLLSRLHGSIPMVVASNSPRRLVDVAIRRAGLEAFFDSVVTVDDVERPKPAKDLYVEACRRAGFDADRCIAFEDSGTGVRSAVAAGTYVVGVPTLADVDLDSDVMFCCLAHPALIEMLVR